VTADIEPGRVTAFLGANGSGKTTSMRMLLGLTAPTAGTATIDGRPYRDLKHPTRIVGAVLDPGFHPNRSARRHLRIAAMQAGVPEGRADELLQTMGLAGAADRRVGGYSLGMRQRLGLASALIGDPRILVLDEPFNGLDPDGIQTTRAFLADFADRGGTVFLSSHLLSEIAHVADDALILDHGRLVAAGPVAELVDGPSAVTVTSPDADALAVALTRRGATVERPEPGHLTVTGLDAESIGRTAVSVGAVITGMRDHSDDLESIFSSLIHQEVAA
jgi:ABC-2 type transport system ATP-binding protein